VKRAAADDRTGRLRRCEAFGVGHGCVGPFGQDPRPRAEPGPAFPEDRLIAGRYRLRWRLGRGGMGVVWLAEDEALHRTVAVKRVALSGSGSAEDRSAAHARALHEKRMAARVDHPGTVRVYGVVEAAGHPWIVMEVLIGRTLAKVLRDHGPLPVRQVARLGLHLLDALQAIHGAGVVHRDVKPGNVQLCGGRVVLTDFGIATTARAGFEAPSRMIVGSPAYMSPELLHRGGFGPASDLFSLGATLYAAVEGRSPFGRACLRATLTAVANDPPAPFLRAGPLRPVIERLLAKDPGWRPGPDQARAALAAIR
jgi:serine/threonine protein kinase